MALSQDVEARDLVFVCETAGEFIPGEAGNGLERVFLEKGL